MNILVIAEHDNKSLKSASLSVLAAAHDIVNKSGSTGNANIDVLVAGHNTADNLEGVVGKLTELNVINKVAVVNNPAYEHGLAEDYADIIAELAKDYQYILLPASTFGKNISPRVAALLDVNPLSDIIEVVDQETFRRPIYAGNAIAKVKLTDAIKVLTVRPTSFDVSSINNSGVATEVLNLNSDSNNSKQLAKFVSYQASESDRPELTDADIVISGGRGLQSKENFELIEKLADLLNAAVGASRAAVDAGYVPNDYQVGQTGKVVAPSLYIAVGISGAIQHIAGMQESKVIVAINKDEEAPIFKIADYGLVGDLFKILPELTDKIAALKN